MEVCAPDELPLSPDILDSYRKAANAKLAYDDCFECLRNITDVFLSLHLLDFLNLVMKVSALVATLQCCV